jgi:hypothetical protein
MLAAQIELILLLTGLATAGALVLFLPRYCSSR